MSGSASSGHWTLTKFFPINIKQTVVGYMVLITRNNAWSDQVSYIQDGVPFTKIKSSNLWRLGEELVSCLSQSKCKQLWPEFELCLPVPVFATEFKPLHPTNIDQLHPLQEEGCKCYLQSLASLWQKAHGHTLPFPLSNNGIMKKRKTVAWSIIWLCPGLYQDSSSIPWSFGWIFFSMPKTSL